MEQLARRIWQVAPFAGAWIEIQTANDNILSQLPSLPSRERGLKSDSKYEPIIIDWSLPSRERGLKYLLPFFRLNHEVAPFAGAWIEMKH